MKKIKPSKVTFYRFKSSKTEFVYVLKHNKLSLWEKLYNRMWDYPPHIELWFEKILVIYEE